MVCEATGPHRLLIVPPLFDEANKLRHFLVETMRLLAKRGIESVLADLPGTNESLAPLADQSLSSWRDSVASCARQTGATHLLGVRGGALVLPPHPTALAFAPASGASLLRAMLRARVIADREAGLTSERDALLVSAREDGIVLAGYSLGAAMVRELEHAEPADVPAIAQADLGGPGLWLRAEPSHDGAQAEALAAAIAERMA